MHTRNKRIEKRKEKETMPRNPGDLREWTNETTLEFIRLYEKEEVIWNIQHPENKNRHYIMCGWDRISKALDGNFTVGELKKKKDSLMASYRKITTDIVVRKSNGQSYKPTWFAFEAMHRFLKDIYQPKLAENGEYLPTEQSDFDYAIDDEEEEDPLPTEDFETIRQLAKIKQEDFDAMGEDDKAAAGENTSEFFLTNYNQNSRIEKRDENRIRSTKRKRFDTLMEKSLKYPVDIKEDEFDTIGKLFAWKLRRMNESQRDVAEYLCNKILYFGLQNKLTEETDITCKKSTSEG